MFRTSRCAVPVSTFDLSGTVPRSQTMRASSEPGDEDITTTLRDMYARRPRRVVSATSSSPRGRASTDSLSSGRSPPRSRGRDRYKATRAWLLRLCGFRLDPVDRPPIHPLAKSAWIAKAGCVGGDLIQRTSCTCNQCGLLLLPLCPNGATRLQPRAPPGGTNAARLFALKGRDKGNFGTMASRGASASVRIWELLPQVSPRRNG